MAHRPDDQLQSPETNRASSPVNDVSCPARRDREPDQHQRKSAAPPSGLPGPQPIIERFARLLVTSDGAEAERLAMVRQLRESGWTLDAVVLSLFVPAARRLGDYWLDDSATFIDVTIAIQRLTSQLFEHERAEAKPVGAYGGHVMLVSAPEDQHGFGIVVLEFFLRRAGWHVLSTIQTGGREVIERARHTAFDAIGFSLGHDRSIEPLRQLIRMTRLASRNRDVAIGVGGPAIVGKPETVRALGADFSSSDAAGLVAILENLCPGRLYNPG